MGGFEAPGTGKILVFEDPAYEGLEVKTDSVPLGLFMGILKDYSALTAETLDVAKAAPVIEQLLKQFGEVLEEWNVTRRGEPVPATYEGLCMLDPAFAMAVIGAWVGSSAAASPPLPGSSLSGGTSGAELAAMAALSSSLPSSSPQKLLSAWPTAGTACRRR